MIRVQAASRLHFGLLRLPAVELPIEKDMHVLSSRQFGGVGLMVQDPGVQLTARPASAWSAEGPLAERALVFVERFCKAVHVEGACEPPQPHHFVLERMARDHVGLGTGTQLGLAVARALAESCGLAAAKAPDLARWVGRGFRSSLGVHGFFQGGFLVEAGKTRKDTLAPLVARFSFPESWSVVLVFLKGSKGLHGGQESQAFLALLGQRPPEAWTDALCRLVLLGMLPALAERDLPAFGDALYEFNHKVGQAFRPVQGGTYAHPAGEQVVSFVRRQNILGVGQSSWGPTLFAVTADVDQGMKLADQLRLHFSLSPGEVLVTSAVNGGAKLEFAAAGASPL
jgi:beta-RFAP synthase